MQMAHVPRYVNKQIQAGPPGGAAQPVRADTINQWQSGALRRAGSGAGKRALERPARVAGAGDLLFKLTAARRAQLVRLALAHN